MHIYSHNEHSEGARELARAMGIMRIKHQGSRYRAAPNKSIINWGSSQIPQELRRSRILNSPEVIARMANKLEFFRVMDMNDNVRIVPWTGNAEEAIRGEAPVVARTVLTGHSGAGIIMWEAGQGVIPRAPLYTKYVKKKAEFRVHCMRGQGIIDVQAKKVRNGHENPNFQIRNHDNGFVYCRNEIDCPDDVRRQALACFEASGLDFGAVDVIYNARENQAYCLEINTAPGLQGETVEIYARAFQNVR